MKNGIVVILLFLALGCGDYQPRVSGYVNPFLGTAPLIDSVDIGYTPPTVGEFGPH